MLMPKPICRMATRSTWFSLIASVLASFLSVIGISMSITFGVSIYFVPMVAIKSLLGGLWLFWPVVILRQKTIRPTTGS